MKKKISKFLRVLGPGFITGASDDDPSGIATYSQAGAQFGYGQLWTAPFSFPFMATIQEMCGRIGIVSGKGLSGVIRDHYSKKILYFAVSLLFLANVINIGADLGAMAASAQLIFGIPFIAWLLFFSALIIFLEIFLKYKTYARVLKLLTFSLFSYVIAAFVVRQNWGEVFKSTIIPSFSLEKGYILNIVAILGTTISPYLFFWQSDEEAEEENIKHKVITTGKGIPRLSRRMIGEMRLDTIVGMFFSNLVMFFIIILTGSTLYSAGIRNIETAQQAAEALRPVAGNFAFLLFAAGIIGVGFLAVPILSGSASYALSEAFSWKVSLNMRFSKAHKFYLIIVIATLFGILINLLSVPPFKMLYYSAVINGLCAPPLLILIMKVSNNKKIMGDYTNSSLSNVMGIATVVIMTTASLALILSFSGII